MVARVFGTIVHVCLTIFACKTTRTVAAIVVDEILASRIVLTWIFGTIIDIYLAAPTAPTWFTIATEICLKVDTFSAVLTWRIVAHVSYLLAAIAPETGWTLALQFLIPDLVMADTAVEARIRSMLATFVNIHIASFTTSPAEIAETMAFAAQAVYAIGIVRASELNFRL